MGLLCLASMSMELLGLGFMELLGLEACLIRLWARTR